jgi:hypothetical protein
MALHLDFTHDLISTTYEEPQFGYCSVSSSKKTEKLFCGPLDNATNDELFSLAVYINV